MSDYTNSQILSMFYKIEDMLEGVFSDERDKVAAIRGVVESRLERIEYQDPDEWDRLCDGLPEWVLEHWDDPTPHDYGQWVVTHELLDSGYVYV